MGYGQVTWNQWVMVIHLVLGIVLRVFFAWKRTVQKGGWLTSSFRKHAPCFDHATLQTYPVPSPGLTFEWVGIPLKPGLENSWALDTARFEKKPIPACLDIENTCKYPPTMVGYWFCPLWLGRVILFAVVALAVWLPGTEQLPGTIAMLSPFMPFFPLMFFSRRSNINTSQRYGGQIRTQKIPQLLKMSRETQTTFFLAWSDFLNAHIMGT